MTMSTNTPTRRVTGASEPEVLATIERSMLRISRRQTRRALGSRAAAEAAKPVALEHIPVLMAAEEGLTERGEITVGDIAELMGIDPSRASRAVTSAIKAGYLYRIASQEDGRRTCVTLTPEGRSLVDHSHMYRQQLYGRVLAGWTENDKAHFAGLLNRFTEAL